jgi:transposase
MVRIDRKAVHDATLYPLILCLDNGGRLTLQDAASGYKGLMVIERCFRTLKKTRIKMSPLYHWAPRRIEAHVKICTLALLIERVAELGCNLPWGRIFHGLEDLQISYFSTVRHRFFRRN